MTVCHLFCHMTKMAAWKFFLQNGGISEGFTHKMAVWEICIQDGGVSESYPQDRGVGVLPTRWWHF